MTALSKMTHMKTADHYCKTIPKNYTNSVYHKGEKPNIPPVMTTVKRTPDPYKGA